MSNPSTENEIPAPGEGFHLLDYQNMTNGSSPNLSLQPDGSGGGNPFFDTYFSIPRFSVETVLAVMAAGLNGLILAAVRNAYSATKRGSVYNTLFVNLAVADILSCLLSWFCNNLFFLLSRHMSWYRTPGQICQLLVYGVSCVFVGNSFGMVSTLTMLGFTTVQYFAICRPLHHLNILRPKKVCIFIGCSWVMSMLAGIAPFLTLSAMSRDRQCSQSLLMVIMNVVVYGSYICLAILAVIYVAIVGLCARIYLEIYRVHRQMARVRYDQDFHRETKAFVTIIILLSTLAIFFIPYTIMYVVSLNSPSSMSGMQSDALIYYMMLLPYLKFLSDPIIYGLRMREVQEGCLRLALSCGMGNCPCIKRKMTLLQRNTGGSVELQRMHSNSLRVTSETYCS